MIQLICKYEFYDKGMEVIRMKYYVVDAFAEKVFEGNPAGVCIMEEWLSDDIMQKYCY